MATKGHIVFSTDYPLGVLLAIRIRACGMAQGWPWGADPPWTGRNWMRCKACRGGLWFGNFIHRVVGFAVYERITVDGDNAGEIEIVDVVFGDIFEVHHHG